MRHLPLALLVFGCSPDDEDTDRVRPVVDTAPFVGGSLSACAGFHSGSYRGDEQGAVEAILLDTGIFTWTFVTPSGPVELLVDAADGAVFGESDQAVVIGAYDFERCRAEGTWARADYPVYDGTWAIAFE